MAKQATATATAAKKVKVLTEPDLLKAPDKDYMNDAQLAFFRRRLTELRDQLLQNADDTGEHLRENETTTDPSDRATLEEEYTLELRTRDRERKLLKKVEKSIRMIDEGNYGYCEETGEPIGIPRLPRASHGDTLARGAGAPRASAEAVRGLKSGPAPSATGRRPPCGSSPPP
jgi:DnaK suppressor protein